MNYVRLNNVYTAASHKRGTSKDKDWEAITIKDKNGKNPVTVFVENIPSHVEQDGLFRIDKISGISFGNRQGNDGKWYPSMSINATVTPVSNEAARAMG